MNVAVTINDVASIKWKLADVLEAEGLNAYKLAMEVDHSRANTVYRLARKGEALKRVDLEVLADLLVGLRKLTGKGLMPNDLIEFDPTDN
jgi:predicted ArsR family transcriptional regulator